jgi:hypothetical protein
MITSAAPVTAIPAVDCLDRCWLTRSVMLSMVRSAARAKAKAQVALGNTQLKVYHKLLSNPGLRYHDLGPDYYERQAAIRRKIAYHVREIEALGLEVTLARIPEPDPDGPATTQAA